MPQNPQNRDIVVAALRHAAPYVRLYRRKTFVNSAAIAARPLDPGALLNGLLSLGLTERARAEEIPLEGFLRLATLLTPPP